MDEKIVRKEKIYALRVMLLDVIDTFQNLPPYEVVHALMLNAVSIALHLAPSHLIAIKTLLASMEDAIEQYEDYQDTEANE